MRKRWIVVFVFVSMFLAADIVEITADNMEAKESDGRVVFWGNVTLVEAESWLKSKELIVYFDEQNQTDRFEAKGDVVFELRKNTNHYVGDCKRLEYFPKKHFYILYHKAHVEDKVAKRFIYGEEIHIDIQKGDALAKSDGKKPVKVIFEVQK